MENKELTKLTEKYLQETDENIIGVSYGYNMVGGKLTKEKVISFTVKEKLKLEDIEPDKVLPTEITHEGETFYTDVVEGSFELFDIGFCYPEHYTWWQYWQQNPTIPSNRNVIRPLKGGVSATNLTSNGSTVGTLGFLAVDKETNSLVGVSNNHVLIDDAFIATERTNANITTDIKGDITTQPHESGNNGSSYKIGNVKRYVPITDSATNYVDGALTTINATHVNSSESWKQEGLAGITVAMPFATTSEINNLLTTDPLLFSTGRTSGAKGELDTKLKVTSVNESFYIKYNNQGVETPVLFSDCISFVASGTTIDEGDYCFFPLAPGDSGSALIADFSGTKKIIGLCFAGNSVGIPLDQNDPQSPVVQVSYFGFACRIDKVAEELNIEAWTGQPVEYSTANTDNFEECIIEGLDSRPFIVKDDKTFWQAGITDSQNLCVPD